MGPTTFRPRRAHVVVGVAALMLVAMLSGAAILIARDRAATLAAAATTQNNLALGLEREILRNVDIFDLSLRAAGSGLRLIEGTSDPALQNAILFDGATAARYFRPIVIADAAGTVVRDSAAPAPRIPSVAGRPFFEAHRSHDDLGLLVQLNTRSTIDGRPYLSLSRRVRAADGGFGGLVAGGLELTYFTDIFSRFTLPAGGAIALIGYDGRLVAGFPFRPEEAGRPVGPGLLAAARRGDTMDPDTRSLGDGRAHVATIRPLGRLPFFIAVSTPRTAILANWTLRAWITGAGLLGFVATSCVLVSMLWRELGRRRQAQGDAVAAVAVARAGAARLATYVDHLADGLLAIRRADDGRLVLERVNEAAAGMLGIEPGDAVGRTAGEVWSGPSGASMEERWRECLATEETLRFEHVLPLAGGSRVLRFVLAPVHDGCGDAGDPMTLLLASVRDVTDTVELEARLRQSQRMDAVGQLTAGVAHDFNNILQAQLGALELLTDEVADRPHALELAELALQTGQHGARLTHSLLSFSRQQHLAPQPVPVAAMLDGLRRMLARALGPLVSIDVSVQDAAAAPFVDPAQLEAALLNLALNARDAMPAGGSVRIAVRPWQESDGHDAWPDRCAAAPVLVAVSDSGQGMTPEVIAKACEPFFTTKGVGKGSGLGLSMVQGFVQQSGGTMRIRSQPGRGTSVELWLPPASAVPACGPSAAGAEAAWSGRVLLVDDSPDVLAITADLLEAAGFTVVQAAHGEEALGILDTEAPFDVLVTDYTMPGMDGGRLVRAVRARCPGLAALILTGQADIDGLRGLPPRVEVLRKPLGGRALARHIADAMEAARANPALALSAG